MYIHEHVYLKRHKTHKWAS